MTPHSIANASSSFLLHVIDPALRSLALGALAALALYIFRVKNPTARLAVWTGVLYAALAMPLLGIALPSISLPVPATFVSFLARTTVADTAAEKPAPVSMAAVSVAPNGTAETFVSPAIDLSAPTVRGARHAQQSKTSAQPPVIAAEIIQAPAETHVATLAAPQAVVTPIPQPRSFPWSVIDAIFCAVAAFMLGRILLGAIIGGRLARSADAIADPGAIRILLRQARAAGVASAPRLAESDVVSVPVALGIVKPAILLPTYWSKWDGPTLAAVIAHEMSHIARRDALTQRLALIHRAIFWFSPLAWWLNRSLVNAAEEASDEAALLAGADRTFYAETLLGFFAALSENSRRRVYWQGVSMAAPGQAERRVDRILNWKGAISMRIRKSLAIGLVLFGVPVALLTAAARPATTDEAPPAPPAPRAPSAPSVFSLPAAPRGPEAPPTPAFLSAMPAPQAAPAPAAPPAAPVLAQVGPPPAAPAAPQAAPVPPAPPAASWDMVNPDGSVNEEKMQAFEKQMKDFAKDSKNFKFDFDKDIAKNLQMQIVMPKMDMKPFVFAMQDGPLTKISMGDFGDRFVIVSNDSPIIMSGNSQDVEHATALRSTIKGDFIWFQHDEKSYVIRDQALVNQAKAFFKPEEDLGQQQRALGEQQRALGDQQRDLGQKMRDVRVTVPDMTADLQKVEAQIKQLSGSGATQQQVGDAQRQLGELMRKLGQTQSQVGDQDRQIGEQMRGLGDKQRDLGQQQRDLGHKQRDAAQQARTQLKQLLDDAVSKGTAQPE